MSQVKLVRKILADKNLSFSLLLLLSFSDFLLFLLQSKVLGGHTGMANQNVMEIDPSRLYALAICTVVALALYVECAPKRNDQAVLLSNAALPLFPSLAPSPARFCQFGMTPSDLLLH